jgi:16S rRNA (uracil1498-N3)-methyltransferase
VEHTVQPGTDLVLPPDEAHHVRKVLRARPGDVVEVADERGRLFAAELREGSNLSVAQELETAVDERTEVVLYQAVPKGRHMDLVAEKATEVGVSEIVPLITDYGVVKLDGGYKVERWRRVCASAARQALRLRIPVVREPVSFADAVGEVGGRGLLLHNASRLPSLEERTPEGPVGLFVGPEGGWSAGEMEVARGVGMRVVQLGPYRLRSETAGIVAVARARAMLEVHMARGA